MSDTTVCARIHVYSEDRDYSVIGIVNSLCAWPRKKVRLDVFGVS